MGTPTPPTFTIEAPAITRTGLVQPDKYKGDEEDLAKKALIIAKIHATFQANEVLELTVGPLGSFSTNTSHIKAGRRMVLESIANQSLQSMVAKQGGDTGPKLWNNFSQSWCSKDKISGTYT